jgi:aminobenzoyl-glutamate utilization protein B
MPTGGGSDDIGDIMWTVPTATIFFPSNIPNTIGHNVTAAMSMATPIAHKGAIAGAKAVAMTVLDLMTSPDELAKAKAYFDNDQQKFDHYAPLISASDVPAIHVNDDYMRTYRPLMEPYYFDSKKYDTYLDQLGIKYPNPPTSGIRRPAKSGGAPSNTGGG